MLKAIYDYAIQRGLALSPGYAYKQIKYYINLASDGEYLGLIPGDEVPVLCPDIGSLANGKDKSNVLAEKRSVLLNPNSDAKSTFFRNALSDCGGYEPALIACRKALDSPDVFAAICSDADQNKIKDIDRLSFMVDGKKVLHSEKVREWWQHYRMQLQEKPDDSRRSLCLITGEPTVPLATVPTVSGLFAVGGHSKGDALICFDKKSFRSYNLEQSANAPVSEEAFFTVKAGLDNLLKEAPILAGMKFVHWYDRPVPVDEDIIKLTIGMPTLGDDDDDDDESTDKPLTTQQMKDEEQHASALIKSVRNGAVPPPLASRYTIMMLSGVGGRVMVRRYMQGSYEELQKNLELWESDLSLLKLNGTQLLRPCKLYARLIKLLSYRKNDRKVVERVKDELTGLTSAVLNAIITGAPLPDSVAVRSLAYIRSKMLENDDDSASSQAPDSIACQWLKVWLLRKHRMEAKEEALMERYNPNHPEAAYHCGALLCVYGYIQRLAMPNVNASVIDKFYASAIQMPALAMGNLSHMSVHHLDKIESPSIRIYFEELLDEGYVAVGNSIPATLTLEQQSLFALGYRQMHSRIRAQLAEFKEAAQLRKAEKERGKENGN